MSAALPAAFALGCGGKTGGVGSVDATRGEGGGVIDTSQPGCAGPAPTGTSACPIPAACVDGEWVVVYTSCNPPPPESAVCPADVPEPGGTCIGYEPGLTCSYPYCYDATAPMARCSETSRLWESISVPTCNPPEPECPSEAPAAGADCYSEGAICSYGVCGEPGYAWLQCLSGSWQGNELPCPPPARDAGATDGGD